jgi:UPF0755 protein
MKKTIRIINYILAVLLLVISVIFSVHSGLSSFLGSPGNLKSTKTIYFPSGQSSWEITQTLYKEKIISSPMLFYLSYKLYYKKSFKAGEYQFIADIKPKEVFEKLINGFVFLHKITIPEGLTNNDIINLIAKEEVLEGLVDNIYPDGYLLPETYQYLYGERKQAILERMFKLMNKTLDKIWEERDSNLPYKDKKELLIMASIVQKEAAEDSEMPIIAGVFVNRLKKKMKLQADPTSEYAITMGKEKLGRLLTSKDLKIASPYNTYYIYGLPPGPISCPGKNAIMAAAKPAKHNFLYFVTDGKTRHNFSVNLVDHNKNVMEYKKFKAEKEARKLSPDQAEVKK